MRRLCTLLLALSIPFPVSAAQQEPPALPPEPSPLNSPAPPRNNDTFPARPDSELRFLELTLGYRTWLSFGQSTISMSGSGGYPNIISELKWRQLVNPIQEVSLRTVWGERFIAAFDFGAGTRGGGSLRDQDFNDDNRTNLASDTSHDANDNNIYYFNLDLGYRVLDIKAPGFRLSADVLMGYQFWQETYVARDGVELFPNPGFFPQGNVVSNRFRWNSFRIGAQADLEVSRWHFGSKLMFVPVNYFRDDDVHFLRTDLLQDPSFIDEATGGFGVMFDASVSYRVWRGLSLEAGYRLWYVQGGLGLDVARTTTGDVASPLYQVQTLRHGILLGLHYRF